MPWLRPRRHTHQEASGLRSLDGVPLTEARGAALSLVDVPTSHLPSRIKGEGAPASPGVRQFPKAALEGGTRSDGVLRRRVRRSTPSPPATAPSKPDSNGNHAHAPPVLRSALLHSGATRTRAAALENRVRIDQH